MSHRDLEPRSLLGKLLKEEALSCVKNGRQHEFVTLDLRIKLSVQQAIFWFVSVTRIYLRTQNTNYLE